MWEFVSGVLKDTERIRVGMDVLIEQKRAAKHGDPEREERAWLEQLSEVNQERRSYQRLAVKGHMTDEELDDALLELEEVRKTAERELDALRHRQEETEALERDREALMGSLTTAVPDGLDHLTPEGRNEIYHRLRMEIRPKEGGSRSQGRFVLLNLYHIEGNPPRLQHLIDPAVSQPLSAQSGRHPVRRGQPLRASHPRDPRQAAEGGGEGLPQRRGRGCDRHHKRPGAEGGHNETLKRATPATPG
jgi:hypothetical protein